MSMTGIGAFFRMVLGASSSAGASAGRLGASSVVADLAERPEAVGLGGMVKICYVVILTNAERIYTCEKNLMCILMESNSFTTSHRFP